MSKDAASAVHHYRVFGLSLRSAITLPELATIPGSDTAAVEIVLGDVPVIEAEGRAHWLTVHEHGAILSVPGVARFLIVEGRRIVVDADAGASPRNVRLYLLGSAMGAVLHQRGMLPLHANAVELNGEAVAFLGHSGAGKSTLAAAFQDRGHPILSDDVCVVTRQESGFFAQPGIPRLRLWRDAIERSGRAVLDYERAFDSVDKYTVPAHAAGRAALPLAAIFLLARQDQDRPASIERLTGTAALQALVENTYRGSFIEIVGDTRAHFETCLKLAAQTPMFCFSRPWNALEIDRSISELGSVMEELLLRG